MTDEYRLDSHKLIYHVKRVSDWLEGETVYPIYMEASPSGACNHRCTFCGLDFMEYQVRFLDWEIFRGRLTELAQLGLKSIMYGGEGEPLMHKKFAAIIAHGKECGLDNAITTNGTLLKPELAEQILPHTEWIKVSFNAGTRETYGHIHGTKSRDFDLVLENLKAAGELKRAKGYRCTLGLQMILLPENRSEAETLAHIARGVGVDYLVIKPYSQHLMSHTTAYRDITYAEDLRLADKLAELNTEAFQVIFRMNTMRKWDNRDRQYGNCFSLPFWSYIDAGGGVWGCSCFLGDQRFFYGNIYENSFKEIWEGEKRRESLSWVENEMDVADCRVNCRMDEVNRYLWQLKNSPPHVNFI